MNHTGDDPDTRLAAAKIWLVTANQDAATDVGNMPYAASAVLATTSVATGAVESMAMDDRLRLYVNRDWVCATPIPEIAARLAHLVWHVLFGHADRARELGVTRTTAPEWGSGADASMFDVFERAGLLDHDLPDPVSFRWPPGRSAEEYYALATGLPAVSPDETDSAAAEGRPAVPDSSCGSACDGRPRHYEVGRAEGEPGMGEVELTALRREVSIAYRGLVTDRGTVPAEFARMIRRLQPPVIPWERVLAASVRRAVGWVSGATDYTYSRRSRRQASVPQMILQGMHRPAPRIAVIIDTSGSIDDTMLGRAAAEVDGALRAVGVPGACIDVLSCDSAVHTSQRVAHGRAIRLGGGGGTDLRVGLHAASRLRPRPEVMIVLTDGYTPWPDRRPPNCHVVIGVLGRARGDLPPTPPWAQRVECIVEP